MHRNFPARLRLLQTRREDSDPLHRHLRTRRVCPDPKTGQRGIREMERNGGDGTGRSSVGPPGPLTAWALTFSMETFGSGLRDAGLRRYVFASELCGCPGPGPVGGGGRESWLGKKKVKWIIN